jgi:hypothetical protein
MNATKAIFSCYRRASFGSFPDRPILAMPFLLASMALIVNGFFGYMKPRRKPDGRRRWNPARISRAADRSLGLDTTCRAIIVVVKNKEFPPCRSSSISATPAVISSNNSPLHRTPNPRSARLASVPMCANSSLQAPFVPTASQPVPADSPHRRANRQPAAEPSDPCFRFGNNHHKGFRQQRLVNGAI